MQQRCYDAATRPPDPPGTHRHSNNSTLAPISPQREGSEFSESLRLTGGKADSKEKQTVSKIIRADTSGGGGGEAAEWTDAPADDPQMLTSHLAPSSPAASTVCWVFHRRQQGKAKICTAVDQ